MGEQTFRKESIVIVDQMATEEPSIAKLVISFY
jgi:hypothetical protein